MVFPSAPNLDHSQVCYLNEAAFPTLCLATRSNLPSPCSTVSMCLSYAVAALGRGPCSNLWSQSLYRVLCSVHEL